MNEPIPDLSRFLAVLGGGEDDDDCAKKQKPVVEPPKEPVEIPDDEDDEPVDTHQPPKEEPLKFTDFNVDDIVEHIRHGKGVVKGLNVFTLLGKEVQEVKVEFFNINGIYPYSASSLRKVSDTEPQKETAEPLLK